MKRALATAMVFAFVLSFSTPAAFALPEPILKLKNGFMDILTSPLEIKKNAVDEVKASHYNPLSLVGGVLKGSFYMVKKSVMGAKDIVTFLVK